MEISLFNLNGVFRKRSFRFLHTKNEKFSFFYFIGNCFPILGFFFVWDSTFAIVWAKTCEKVATNWSPRCSLDQIVAKLLLRQVDKTLKQFTGRH